MTKKIVIWGAGKIGRGFIADLFAQEGYDICLVDESPELVRQLNEQGSYTVVHAGSKNIEQIKISGYKAITTQDSEELQKEFDSTNLIALAVFPKNFETVAAQVRKLILQRKANGFDSAINLILCTNLIHAGPKFKEFLLKDLAPDQVVFFNDCVGIVEALVIRIAPVPPQEAVDKDPLVVWTNGFAELPVDKQGFRGILPHIKSLRLVEDMRAEEIRKIYTYNMCHAVLSYQGKFFDYPLLVDCLEDKVIRVEAESALSEVSAALQKEFGFAEADMRNWIANVLEHTNNPTVGDTVARSAADPKRKLARDDRLIGPTLLCLKNDIDPKHLIRGIAAAFHYYDEGDPSSIEIQQTIKKMGIAAAVRRYCGLGAEDESLLQRIVEAYRRLPLEYAWRKKSWQAYQLGMEYEEKYHGCGQSVVAAVTEVLGVFNEEVFKTATGLSGGIGQVNDSTCSAFIGGVLSIGLIFYRERKNFDGDRESKYKNFELVQKYRTRFIEELGSNYCAKIHTAKYGRPYDLTDKAEQKKFDAAGAHARGGGCTDVTGKASMLAIEVLSESLIERELSRETSDAK
ncbi:MAG: hypothetical protein HPY72_09365 [Anaerolineae bacterium]|nr:hypothetical protein [Anaerolineae bacterium]